MIEILKPFHNASADLEGAVPTSAIVIYAKRPDLMTTINHGLDWHLRGFHHHIETKVVRWQKYLYIDLWFIKFKFYWKTKNVPFSSVELSDQPAP